MLVSIDQTLNFLYSVNNEDVNEIFARSVQPVIEWSSPFGEFQMENVDLLHHSFGLV